MVMTGSPWSSEPMATTGKCLRGRALAVAAVLADIPDVDAHREAVLVAVCAGAGDRHPEDVPEASGFVLEASVALGEGNEALPDGARDGDGDGESGFARGFGDVDERPFGDGLGAGVGGKHGAEVGERAGWRHEGLRCGKEDAGARRKRGVAPAGGYCGCGVPDERAVGESAA